MENPPRRRRPVQPAQPDEQMQMPLTPPPPGPAGSRRRAQPVLPQEDAPKAAQPERSAPPKAKPAAPKAADPKQKKPKQKKKKKKRRSKKLLIALLLLLLLLIALVIGGMYMINRRQKFERYQFDTEAMAGRIQMMTEEEIQAELNRVIEEGMFNISIASSIVFESPTGKGEARIENIPANNYHMQVDITLDETGELVYASNLIRPGYSIEKIKLDKELAPGEYEATAVFSAITQKEMQLFGQAAAKIRLYVMDEEGRLPTPSPAPTAEPTAAP